MAHLDPCATIRGGEGIPPHTDPQEKMTRPFRAVLPFVTLLLGCENTPPSQEPPIAQDPPVTQDAPAAQDTFWASLQALCGEAHPGVMVQGSAADTAFANNPLVMHVRECSDSEIRIPFHVGEDRSRTWILTRTDDGLRLKHDHRHDDGTEDEITQYGGDTRDWGTATTQEFYVDTYTVNLVPGTETNVWTVEVVPGERFAYELRRIGTDRRVRVEFDLTRTVSTPPAPWGYPDQ
jgi:hypothetical protein